VGNIPIKLLRHFFQKWDDEILVSTNGEFLRKNYHKDEILRPYIKHIMLHAFENLPPNILPLFILPPRKIPSNDS